MRRSATAHDVTPLLRAWSEGNEQALERLIPLVYRELHRIARGCMARENPNQTLQATALVNEAYLRLVDVQHIRWQDRAHFFALCARAMRRILVDHARSRASLKRGAGQVCLELQEGRASSKPTNLLGLDEALNRLAALDLRKSQVVELRFFGGLSEVETAAALGVSEETVQRDWRMARTWLYRELGGNKKDG
jgi:RNA polymerase sigma-70 factor (ECF subfamily)